jgi:hypothetical protein
MTAQNAGIGPPKFQKATAQGDKSKGGIACCVVNGERLGNTAEAVNSEVDRLLRQWLRTGEDFPRRLAHTLRDAARKQQGGI